VARAKASEVIDSARKGKNTLWYKYYNGKWQEPAMGGKASGIGNIGNHTTMMYNTYIKKWITFPLYSSYYPPDGQTRTIRMRTTLDPLDFHPSGEADEIIHELPKGDRAAYFSIMPDQADMTTCGKEFYLYYRYWSLKENPGYHTARLKISFE